MQVLYVEDDPMNRFVVRDMLGVAGAQLAEAPDAETGLRLIDERSFDVVLMDLRMPGIDGMTAVRRIRGRGDAKAAVPIIVVTADTALNIRETCIAGGADEVIFKPVAMRALFDAIGRMVLLRSRRGSAAA